jgi:beta-N-acetylhexosaminidase
MTQPHIKEKMDRLSLEEKIGLLFTVVLEGTTPSPAFNGYVMDFHMGGIRVVTSDRFKQKSLVGHEGEADRFYLLGASAEAPHVTLAEYSRTVSSYLSRAYGKNGIPLRVVFDQEGGFSRDLTFGNAHVFPKPMGYVAGGDPEVLYQSALAVGRLARACGINMIHSPILDVNVNPCNPEIYTRAFSDRAEVVAEYAIAQARGFKDTGLIATGKHFPGRGDSIGDAHFEIPVIDIDYDTLWNRELLPYRTLIQHDVLPAIMTAHSLYPAVDTEEVATLSEKILKGVLRDKMGFEGVITTDAIGMGGITLKYDVVTACLKALQAGADMVLLRMATDDPIGVYIPRIVERIKLALDQNELSGEELDSKVHRILKAYDDAGLFAAGGLPQEPVDDILRDQEIKAVCHRANAGSICVYRNKDNILPLPKNTRALVIEQRFPRIYCPQDGGWYTGLLYDSLCRYSNHLSYIETHSVATPEEEETVFKCCEGFDLIIMSNWFYRSDIQSNSRLVKALIEQGKRVLVLANTPYREQCIPDAAGTVIVQFGVTPESIAISSDIIFGAAEAQGTWPVAYTP